MIDEIDKMGADFRGDPVLGDARGARPGAERLLPRPLPRPRVRPLRGRCSSPPRTSSTRSRGPLQDRMETIELAGYTLEEKRHIARRYLVPRQIEANGLKPSQIEFADPALTAIIEEYTREAGVRNLEREIGAVCRKIAREVAEGKVERQGEDLGEAGARAARPPPLLRRAAPPHQGPRRRHRARLDADRRRRPLHRGDRDAGLGRPDDHRPARRRDEGVRAGGALLRARPLEGDRARARGGLVRQARHPHPRARRRGPQGRALGRGRDDRRARLADQRPAGSQRRGDDRRGDADRPGAADRRPEGEVAGRPARRDQAGDRARAQRGRRRPRSPSTSAASWSSSTWTRSPRRSTRPSPSRDGGRGRWAGADLSTLGASRSPCGRARARAPSGSSPA